MFDRRGPLACVLIAFALSPWASAIADPPASPSNDGAKRVSKVDDADLEADDELLEFLGSVDAEDGELIDYYSKRDGATRQGSKTATGAPADRKTPSSTSNVSQKTIETDE